MSTTPVPSYEALIPYIIWSFLGIISGFGVWLVKSLIPKLDELIKAVNDMKDEHQKGHSALCQALLLLTFKIKNPDADVSNEATKISYPSDEKKT